MPWGWAAHRWAGEHSKPRFDFQRSPPSTYPPFGSSAIFKPAGHRFLTTTTVPLHLSPPLISFPPHSGFSLIFDSVSGLALLDVDRAALVVAVDPTRLGAVRILARTTVEVTAALVRQSPVLRAPRTVPPAVDRPLETSKTEQSPKNK
jgi:hypothetical protein